MQQQKPAGFKRALLEINMWGLGVILCKKKNMEEQIWILWILHFVQNYVSDIALTVKLLPILVEQNRINTTVGNDPFFFSKQDCKCSHRFCPVTMKDRLLYSTFKDQHVWIVLVEREELYPKSNKTPLRKFCLFIYFFFLCVCVSCKTCLSFGKSQCESDVFL